MGEFEEGLELGVREEGGFFFLLGPATSRCLSQPFRVGKCSCGRRLGGCPFRAVLLGCVAIVFTYSAWPWKAQWWGLNSGSHSRKGRGVFGWGAGCFWVTESVS